MHAQCQGFWLQMKLEASELVTFCMVDQQCNSSVVGSLSAALIESVLEGAPRQ
jgi:hypothetical protein